MFVAIVIMISISSISENLIAKQPVKELSDTLIIKYPANVKTIINSKCYQCHNLEAKSEKAKNKLNFDGFSSLSKSSQLSKLDKIMEVMDEGSMPPKKFIERAPSAKLTDNEAKTLKEWAKTTSDMIIK